MCTISERFRRDPLLLAAEWLGNIFFHLAFPLSDSQSTPTSPPSSSPAHSSSLMGSSSRLPMPRPQPPETNQEPGDEPFTKFCNPSRKDLLSFDSMPPWFRRESNPFINHSYRPISNSARTSFSSLSNIHNETVNIYSHLIPAILFCFGEWYIQQYFTSKYPAVTTADCIAFPIFMLAAAIWLSLSATYHTLMNHSQHVERMCLGLDMLGVVTFILGDLVLGIYITFWCGNLLRNIYWCMVSYPSKTLVYFPLFIPALYNSNTISIYSFMIDRNFRVLNYLHDTTSQIPGHQTPHFPSIDICGDWFMWSCALDTRNQVIRPLTDDEESFIIYTCESRLSPIRDCLLRSKSPRCAHETGMQLKHVVPRPSFLKVDILENSIYAAHMRSFTSW